jgi:hypothetical protein
VGTYAVFSALTTIRSTSPQYGVNNLSLLAVNSTTPSMLLNESGTLIVIIVSMVLLKFAKRALGKGMVVILGSLPVMLLAFLFLTEIRAFTATLS